MSVTGSQIAAYYVGKDKFPIAEFDITLNAGESLSREQLQTEIANAGATSFAYLSVQSQKAEASQEFVGKFSLADGYDLATNQGRKLTALSELLLQPNEASHLQFYSEENGLNLHFTIYA